MSEALNIFIPWLSFKDCFYYDRKSCVFRNRVCYPYGIISIEFINALLEKDMIDDWLAKYKIYSYDIRRDIDELKQGVSND